MRIATYLPTLESHGGVELSVLEVTRELAARGHRIQLFYERPGNLVDDFGSFCEGMHEGPSPLYSATPVRDAPRIALRALAASARRPDLVYANNFSELAWAAGIKALTRAPIVCHLHEFRPVRRSSMSLLGRRVDRFVINSAFMRTAWTNHGLDPTRAEVMHIGLSPADYPPPSEQERLQARRLFGLPEDAYVAVFLGRMIPEKGVDVLLEAWRSLDMAPERARLLLLGVPAIPDAYVDGLRALAPAGCDWRPMQRNVLPALHAADVLVLPATWNEPFGRVIIEAMATGIPAIGSAVGGIPEILSGEFAGLLFPRGDAGALAERLRAVRDWRRTDPGLAAHCAGHVAANFSLDTALDTLEEIFATVRAG